MITTTNAQIEAQEKKDLEVEVGNFVTVDNVKMHFRKGGQGPFLLLLHGFTLSSQQWQEYFDVFSRNYTVIALDFPGHGQSVRTGKEFSFEHWTELTLRFIEELNIESVRAIGHSYGAITLLSIARQKPDLIESMVLISGAHRLDPQMQEILLEDSFDKADKDFQDYYRIIHNNDMEKIEGLFADIRKFAETLIVFSKEEISEISVPTFMIFGDRDTFYPMEIPTEMYQAIPNARLWVVPEQGHTPVWQIMGADTLTVSQFPKQVLSFFKDINEVKDGK